ncbi:MAG: thioesterase family protein, partial [Myxococcales bacterium]|nr:thioesterase family protein [Myxococcales bacterium]
QLLFPKSDLRVNPDGLAQDVLAPTPAGRAGYVAFDTERANVRVVVVDRGADDGPFDHTLKRFPTWGDVSDLIRLLRVRRAGELEYVSTPYDSSANRHRGVVEGSQMLGQAIFVAGQHAPGRRVTSATMVFTRVANTTDPLRVMLEELSSGRTFTSLAVRVHQEDRLCASGIMLLAAPADDVIRHAAQSPKTAGPERSEPYDMSVTGRDVRFVDGAYTGDPDAPVGPPTLDAWVRYSNVPEDPSLHAALLSHFTGHASIATALRPHAGIGQAQAHRTLSTGINAINISFHADVRADRWLRYRHHSTFAGSGMTHSECRVHDAEGVLVASFTVDAMVRRAPAKRTGSERTAL